MKYRQFWFVLVGTFLASSVLSNFEASAVPYEEYCSPERIRTGRSNAAFCDDPPSGPRDIPDDKDDEDHGGDHEEHNFFNPFKLKYPAPTPPPGCTRKQHYAYLSHRAARLLVAGKFEEAKMHGTAAEGYRQAGVELSDDEHWDSMMALGWDEQKKKMEERQPGLVLPDEWTPDRMKSEWGRNGHASKKCSGGTLPSSKPKSSQRQSSSSQNPYISARRYDTSNSDSPTVSGDQPRKLGANLPIRRANQEQKQSSVTPELITPESGGRSVDASLLQPGDIILSTTNSGISREIRRVSGESVSHAMLYIGDGLVVEAIGKGIDVRPLETALNLDNKDEAILAVAFRHPEMTKEFSEEIVDFAGNQLDKKYNFRGVLQQAGFRLGLRPRPDQMDKVLIDLGKGVDQKFYCSELILAAYNKSGLRLTATNHYSPGEIAELNIAYIGHLMGGE